MASHSITGQVGTRRSRSPPASLPSDGAALDVAHVVHDLEGEGELVGVPHQGAQPIVVDGARRAAVRAGQPEQGAGLRAGHEFVMPAQGGVVDGGWQGLDELAEGEVRRAGRGR